MVYNGTSPFGGYYPRREMSPVSLSRVLLVFLNEILHGPPPSETLKYLFHKAASARTSSAAGNIARNGDIKPWPWRLPKEVPFGLLRR